METIPKKGGIYGMMWKVILNGIITWSHDKRKIFIEWNNVVSLSKQSYWRCMNA